MKLLVHIVLLVSIANGHSLKDANKFCSSQTFLNVRCSDDCESLEFCIRGQNYSINCQQFAGRRFCSSETHTCVDDRGSCYNREFCPSTGTYPNLRDCHKYVFCNNYEVVSMNCPNGTVYDHDERSCTAEATCKNFTDDCDGDKTILRHADPKLFVYCRDKRPVLFECPGYSYVFDYGVLECRYQCNSKTHSEHWNYPDDFNTTMYYQCWENKDGMITKPFVCPKGTVFDEAQQKCLFKCGSLSTHQHGKKYVDHFDNSNYYDCLKLGRIWLTVPRYCPLGYTYRPTLERCTV